MTSEESDAKKSLNFTTNGEHIVMDKTSYNSRFKFGSKNTSDNHNRKSGQISSESKFIVAPPSN